MRVLLDDPDILSTDILNTRHDFKGEGVGVIEAPRGTLFHHYWTDENGQLEQVNLIVATGHNNWAMSKAVDSVAKTYITGTEVRPKACSTGSKPPSGPTIPACPAPPTPSARCRSSSIS